SDLNSSIEKTFMILIHSFLKNKAILDIKIAPSKKQSIAFFLIIKSPLNQKIKWANVAVIFFVLQAFLLFADLK
ncbi:hypothetical protein, partial [Acinetobacter radioresistens]|uniref:hypothetical protein n=1 Tax=Acinetobacter radioresistens TaxID=40216 RepID=UPI001C06F5B6